MKTIKLLILIVLLCSINASAEIKGGGYIELSGGGLVEGYPTGGLVGISGAGGIKINSNVFIGVGTGVEVGIGYWSSDVIIPTFVTSKFKFTSSRIAPYIEIKEGTAYSTDHEAVMGYAAPSIGITINKFNVGIGYTGFYKNGSSNFMVDKFGINF